MALYACPMHPEVAQSAPGTCPKCGMRLVSKDETAANSPPNKDSYAPLFIILGIIALGTATVAFRDYSNGVFAWQSAVANFMAGFFLVFSGFKLLDLKGFAEGYSTYDLLAQKAAAYGYAYPFIELFFGLAMVAASASQPLLLAEFVVMSFSGLGVAVKLAKKEKFRCVCLGTAIKLPLTTVTLVEDFGMAMLALLLILAY